MQKRQLRLMQQQGLSSSKYLLCYLRCSVTALLHCCTAALLHCTAGVWTAPSPDARSICTLRLRHVSYLSTPTFQASIRSCCSRLAGKSGGELLAILTEQIRVSELTHNFNAVNTKATWENDISVRMRVIRDKHRRKQVKLTTATPSTR